MADGVYRLLAAAGLAVAVVAGAGCGGSASGGGGDPVEVAKAYTQAVQDNPTGGAQFLASEPTEKLSAAAGTTLSRYLKAHKGAKWAVETVQYPEPNDTIPKPTQKACVIGQPPPGQICIVTVGVGEGADKVYFHINLENRYTGKWEIIDVDQVDGKPDNLLPSGNEAHKA